MSEPIPPGPQFPVRKPSKTPWVIIIVVIAICLVFFCVVFGGILAAIAIPGFLKAKQTAELHQCQENLVQIETAKQFWAEDNLVDDYSVEPPINALVGEYLDTMPVCPSGGTYTVGNLTQLPQCSTLGHDFPED